MSNLSTSKMENKKPLSKEELDKIHPQAMTEEELEIWTSIDPIQSGKELSDKELRKAVQEWYKNGKGPLPNVVEKNFEKIDWDKY